LPIETRSIDNDHEGGKSFQVTQPVQQGRQALDFGGIDVNSSVGVAEATAGAPHPVAAELQAIPRTTWRGIHAAR
jgi:hypothetical protein